MTDIQNGTIKDTFLGVEDHGIMTFSIGIDFDGTWQSFGGYAMDSWNPDKKQRVGSSFGTESVRRVLDALDVDRWERLKGVNVRVRRKDGWNSPIIAIGHIVKDRSYDISEHAKEVNGK